MSKIHGKCSSYENGSLKNNLFAQLGSCKQKEKHVELLKMIIGSFKVIAHCVWK